MQEALAEDETAWEARANAFYDYQALWRDHGFVLMFRRLMRRENVASRLLAFEDGERRLTNLLHLIELLQSAAGAEQLGMEGLIRWLAERRRDADGGGDEAQLRLENDENLVKIATIHKSTMVPSTTAPRMAAMTWLRASERDIAFVFQFFALYPHMTVRENIAFPLESQGFGPDHIHEDHRLYFGQPAGAIQHAHEITASVKAVGIGPFEEGLLAVEENQFQPGGKFPDGSSRPRHF